MSETRWKKDGASYNSGAKIYRDWNERIEQFNRLCGIDQMGYIELISFLTTRAMTTTRYRDIIQSLEHKHTQIVSCRKSEFVIRIWSSLTHLIMIFLWVLLFMKRQQQHQPQWTWNNGNGSTSNGSRFNSIRLSALVSHSFRFQWWLWIGLLSITSFIQYTYVPYEYVSISTSTQHIYIKRAIRFVLISWNSIAVTSRDWF